MAFELTFKPFKKQYQALQYLKDDHTNEVLYGGGARGAKSYLGCAWAILNCYEFPGSAGIIGRNELKRLRQTTLLTFFEVAKNMNLREGEHFSYNAMESQIKFPNGSIIFLLDLSYQPSDQNYDRLGSYGITWAFIDEAQEINYQAINVIKGRFSLLEKLDQDGKQIWRTIPKMLYTCNPAKNWIYGEFYKPFKENRLALNRAFVPALVTDNPSIKPEYIEFLKSSDPVTVQRLLYGNFEYDDDPSSLYSTDEINDLFQNHADESEIKYMVVDVARLGRDSTVVGLWKGLHLYKTIQYNKQRIDESGEEIRKLEIEERIDRKHILIDQDGVGGGLVDILRGSVGFTNNASPIQPMEAKYDPTKRVNFANLKSQCAWKLQELMKRGAVQITEPDAAVRQKISEELAVFKQQGVSSEGGIVLEKDGKKSLIEKDEMKRLLGRSPDYADMINMRMYFELSGVMKTGTPAAERKPIRIKRKIFNPFNGVWEYK